MAVSGIHWGSWDVFPLYMAGGVTIDKFYEELPHTKSSLFELIKWIKITYSRVLSIDANGVTPMPPATQRLTS